jgi:hypothetical protein
MVQYPGIVELVAFVRVAVVSSVLDGYIWAFVERIVVFEKAGIPGRQYYLSSKRGSCD